MEIRLKNLSKIFIDKTKKETRAVDDFNTNFASEKLTGLLGPSGCGKSTMLFLIAGLHEPTYGRIFFGDDDVTRLSPDKRGIGLVFQNYALYPHMTVKQNIMFPLENMQISREQALEETKKIAELVGIGTMLERKPAQLSGGQQQRVAIARALVKKPRVLLLDEPLSNLDAKLREKTRKELKMFLGELGITAVYVTHDRVEALALSDTIGVMNAGNIVELGSPTKIYFDADHQFVADFIGRANLVTATIKEQQEENTIVDTPLGQISCHKRSFAPEDELVLCLRPEFIAFDNKESEYVNQIPAVIEQMTFVGEVYETEVVVGDQRLMTKLDPETKYKEGDKVNLSIKAEHCLLVSK